MPRNFLLFIVWVVLMLFVQLVSRLENGLDLERAPEFTDLGIARYPSTAGTRVGMPDARVAIHRWRQPSSGDRFQLAYAHGLDAGRAIESDHARLAEDFEFRWADENSFRWNIPQDCVGREWTCIYSTILARSEVDLAPMVARIEAGMAAAMQTGTATDAATSPWTTTDAARWLLAFVQQIPYRLPEQHAFGVLPPPLVASRDWGDCDSKALLLIHLLDYFGIDAVLIQSQAHAHALVGVAVPTGQDGFEYRGRTYAWAETTAEHAPLGWLHPDWRTPDDWRVIPLQ